MLIRRLITTISLLVSCYLLIYLTNAISSVNPRRHSTVYFIFIRRTYVIVFAVTDHTINYYKFKKIKQSLNRNIILEMFQFLFKYLYVLGHVFRVIYLYCVEKNKSCELIVHDVHILKIKITIRSSLYYKNNIMLYRAFKIKSYTVF